VLILILTVVNIARVRKKGGAEHYVKTKTLVMYVISNSPALCVSMCTELCYLLVSMIPQALLWLPA